MTGVQTCALPICHYKGIPKREISHALQSGRDVILRIDVQGAATIKRLASDAVFIFLAPGSFDELHTRLQWRRTESPDQMEQRLAMARRDAIELYQKGGREDLVEQEQAEAVILETYLPRQLTADELRPQMEAAIGALGASSMADMGKIMPTLIQQFKGSADGRLISQLAREILSRGN